ncbi:MAG: DUF3748 domain-containing protein [Acidobacteria bacterium]|nr:DUF3748 domain-containing protein [Acidobacteriota bacterium]
MRTVGLVVAVLAVTLTLAVSGGPVRQAASAPVEWQLTATPINHALDNNDNFSKDDRYLVYDTRETLGGGIGNCTSIMKVDVMTGKESVVYAPQPVILHTTNMAPGLGAASFSPVADEAVFIHGPFVSETPVLGFYGATNRRGGVAAGDGSGRVYFLDARDVTNEPTTPGAHRGGTHRHEYTLDGKRVGFTYDDNLLTPGGYGRTIGMMVPHPKAPAGATHWTVLLAPIVPSSAAKTGELDRAADDSWIGAKGLMRGFIGRVMEADGTFMSSLFVVDVPENVDVTTADAGTKTRFPSPPRGVTVRRLTNTAASGIVRGSHDGTRIGYYATAPDGSRQAFIIPSLGSDRDPNPAMRPVQATFLEKGAGSGLRWHPTGNSIALTTDNGVVAVCVKPGPLFGAHHFLSRRGSGVPAPEALVWSRNGRLLAFNRRVPTIDAQGELVKDFNKNDFRQIFMAVFPDENQNGIVDAIEQGVVRNAASFVTGAAAADSWATVTGFNLAAKAAVAETSPLPTSLGGVSVEVTDSAGAKRAAPLHFVSPEQVNFLPPTGTKPGEATVTVTTAGGQKIAMPLEVRTVAPGLFSANASGQGVAAAVAVRIDAQGKQTSQVVFQCTGGAGTCTSVPLDLGPETDEVILLLYGTGIRGFSAPPAATIGGQRADVIGAAAQSQYPGLDQVNVRIPRALAGKGEVPVVLTVDGQKANAVTVNIR